MKRISKPWQWVLLTVVILLLLCVTWELASMTVHAHADWMRNSYSVQERLYEAVSMFFAYAQLLIMASTLLIVSVLKLIHRIRPLGWVESVARWIRDHGCKLTIGFAVACFILILCVLMVSVRITTTAETSEVPATLHAYLLKGWLGIGAVLTGEGTVLSLGFWIQNKRIRKE